MTERPAIDGATRLYGIIGDPIAQVRSPVVFNARFRALGLNAAMVPLHVRSDDFDAGMRGLKALANLDGILVTLPYKNRIGAHVDRVLAAAQRIGAINAIRRDPDGAWSGDMFDGKGLVGGLRANSVDPKGRSFMLIGAGGAGSAIADALAEAGASALTIFDLLEPKARKVAEQVARHHPACAAAFGPVDVSGKDVLINATPTGMAPGDGLPARFDRLDPRLFVVDIIPKPEVTPLSRFAREAGCRTMNGQAMVAGQADAILRFFGLAAT